MKRILSAAAAVCALACAGRADAGLSFTTVDPPGSQGAVLNAINDAGVAVGTGWSGGVMWSNGVTSTFVSPGDYVYGINNAGVITGYQYKGSGVYTPFVMNGAAVTDLPITSPFDPYGTLINDNGVVVGNYGGAKANKVFIYSGGIVTTLSAPGWAVTVARAVDSAGDVLVDGFTKPNGESYLVTGGGTTFVPISVPGSPRTNAFAMNDAGEIVGDYRDASGVVHAFLEVGGVYTSVDFPGASWTEFDAVNSSGEIVGAYQDANGVFHGFTDIGGTFAAFDPPGSTTTNIALGGINAKGQFVGDYLDANGVDHGFVASPTTGAVPEPSTWAMLILGLGAVGLVSRRRTKLVAAV